MSGTELVVRASLCIEDIGQTDWDAFSNGRPFAGYRWHSYGERSMPDCSPFYVSVLKGNQTVSRASFWLVRNEPLPVSNKLIRNWLGRFLSAHPLLICRLPLADASGLSLPPSPLRGEVLKRILRVSEDYARSVKASFLIFDYLDSDQAGLSEWEGRYFCLQMNEPGTCLPITWNSFDEYLKSLSKNAWKDYRRQHNQAHRLNLSVSARAASEINIEEALPLVRFVEARHGAQPKPWARSMLENAQETGATWIEARLQERLVGCGLLLPDGDTLLATLLGLDYSVPYVYFQIMYSAIREAIDQGYRLLRAGSGAYEFKSRLGFRSENNNYLRFSGQTRLLGYLGRLASTFA